MGEVLLSLLPLMLAAAFVPAPLIIALIMLRGDHGVAAGGA